MEQPSMKQPSMKQPSMKQPNMKQPRSELAKFYNECIELKGRFEKLHTPPKYEYKEETGNCEPKSSVCFNPQTGFIHPVYFYDNDKCSECQNAINIIDNSSMIVDVHVIGSAEELVLDHIILQCNILKTYNIPIGSNVKIDGLVGAYRAGNKEGGYDYCIADIKDISNITDSDKE